MSGEEANSHKNLEIGRTLERARAERGLSLWEVEDATKIRARYLHDLERENFDVLPAVYVLGSLKTYADFLGLDGEALARELKNRQEPPQEEPTPEKPAAVERGGLLAALGSLPVIGGREAGDEGAAPAAVLGYGPRLYVGLGAVLILVLAVALGTAFGDGGRPEVSQLREPAVSEAPSQIAFSGDAQDGRDDERNQEAGSRDDRSGERAESPDGEKDEEEDQSGESDQDDTRPEDAGDVAATPPTSVSATASATASASASAPATSASAATAPASAPPETPTPAATAAPEAADPAPTQPATRPAPAANGAQQGGSRQAQSGRVNRSPLAVRIVREVQSATSGTR